ncbi:bifunctional diaminohydroxyphosphoribosylaminopyrimidine deaminase/5-amino-6-(5-phosphoribosylamino)uracil reductase RibD [Extensimonas sp. H3M7-6]|uniref:bifunctional diaminohydroxyphosphoribosylaminopyrimidine deaminase/5-amino-6-(5-phosphoribosylamino)uracil reductase RibD n=1 Tax=Extensimonas soli TaxID=3031322 RepID=UPI0023DAD5BF|nr:bifunctional diaminohydroxyphosphoribosylaminopyrimidine deaminase/5-amino-6-(5-phosphoribosylamino)uracil reductase RibD [Extensimonas sp. H3M7-6]MDF1481558.1 bifunctional diaminohydroxyphosphoribosylaminopyrimidine deaminase/5-amino-6-(5-phosphoribosylamino)uracil reductase RibD [Extensimonas sp. H3M7-6]
MLEALALAQQGLLRTSPNPRVGCVLVDTQGRMIGRGSTQRAGGPHAEIMALRDALAQGHSTRGATAYVTLEPCAHQGRTGPCCDALTEAGIAKVVASITDPNPRVAGQGFARLRAAGVQVEVGPGAEAARELNLGFFSRMVRKTPWVRMKVAASLDGVTALPNGASQWITSPEARRDGHAWRARACAVLTGIGTVLADDPRLDVREVPTERQPALVLVDSALQVPLDASIFIADRGAYIFTASQNDAKKQALEERGVQVITLPDAHGKVDLAAMLTDLALRAEVNELHVEAGYKLNGSLLRAGLVDELLVYLAPKLLGAGAGMAQLGELTALAQAQELEFKAQDRVGPDLRVLARIRGRDRF